MKTERCCIGKTYRCSLFHAEKALFCDFVKKSRLRLLKLLYIVYEYVPDAIEEQESTNTAATYELQVPKQKQKNIKTQLK